MNRLISGVRGIARRETDAWKVAALVRSLFEQLGTESQPVFDYVIVGAGFSGAVVAVSDGPQFRQAGAAGGPPLPCGWQRLRSP